MNTREKIKSGFYSSQPKVPEVDFEALKQHLVSNPNNDDDDYDNYCAEKWAELDDEIKLLQNKVQIAQGKIWLLSNTVDKYNKKISELIKGRDEFYP